MSAFKFYSTLVIVLSIGCPIRSGLINWTSVAVIKNSICKLNVCRERDHLYLQNMKIDRDPCENFYEYACGNWIEHNPIPGNEVQWTVPHTVKLATYEKLRLLLEDKRLPINDSEVTQAKKIYKLCMDIPFLQRGDVKFLRKFTTNIYWPLLLSDGKREKSRSPWWTIEEHYLSVTGESAFFNFAIIADLHSDNNVILEVKNVVSPYGSILHSSVWERSETLNYMKYLSILLKKYAPNIAFTDSFNNDLVNVIKFRQKIGQIIDKSSELENDTYIITLKEFQVWYNNLIQCCSSAKIDWLALIRSIMKNNWNIITKHTLMINIFSKSYIEKLSQILVKTDEDIIANHIHLYFLERHLIYIDDAKHILYKTLHRTGETIGKVRYDTERWYSCIANHNMKDTLGKMYIREQVSKNTHEKVMNIVKNVQNVVKNQITKSSWLDEKSKEWANSKIKLMNVWVAYPPWYNNPSLKDKYKHITMNPIDANTYFSMKNNHMVITAGMLQTPIYGEKMPYVIDYGSTGLIIAHELYHAFDEIGMKYDSKGQSTTWQSDTHQILKNKTECFVDQHKHFCIKKFKRLCDVYKNFHDYSLTYNENLADIMGAKTTYQGYKKQLSREKGTCIVLPHFLSCEKLFFISLANMFCGTILPDHIQRYMKYAIHSTPEIRVNGIVSNMPEFSKAFDCPANSPMNAVKQCDLWQ